MISVAMTSYNGASYIVEQLDSILHQTLPVDEIILCDDGSSDQTLSLVREYIEKNNCTKIKWIQNDKNLGYKYNFKKAMMHCYGDFVFLSGQDDTWLENKVETMIHTMKNRKEIKVLASSFEYINAQGQPLKKREGNTYNNDGLYHRQVLENNMCIPVSFKELLRENYFQGASLCIRKEIVQEFCVHYKDYITHDWFINLCAAKYNGMYYLNTVLFQYRIHEKNNLGIPMLNNSLVNWFLQANQEEKRMLAFSTSNAYIEQLKTNKDPYYLENEKELSEIQHFLQDCLEILKKRKCIEWIKMSTNEMYTYFRSPKTKIMDIVFVLTHKGR
ncbi:MAG: glycosyltransferase [Firmicutes bacterium]|nr:glycosyltransferase [Bacillota bacterium]